MLHHSVIFKFKEGTSELRKREFFTAANRLSLILDVKHFEILRQPSSKNEFEFGLVIVFNDTPVYQKYTADPELGLSLQNYWLKLQTIFLELDSEPFRFR